MRWAEHVAEVGDIRNSYKVFIGKPKGRDFFHYGGYPSAFLNLPCLFIFHLSHDVYVPLYVIFSVVNKARYYLFYNTEPIDEDVQLSVRY